MPVRTRLQRQRSLEKYKKLKADKLKECRDKTNRDRVKKSVCRKIKRSAVCKRTKGCTHAKGKKRSFCRTKKNKKVNCNNYYLKFL